MAVTYVVELVGIEVAFVGMVAVVVLVVVFVVVFVAVAVAVVISKYISAAFVELVASGDSTWVWDPSIVECMGMAWA